MKRFLSKSLTQHARGENQQSAAKKARSKSPERQQAAGSTQQGQQQKQQPAVPRNSKSSPATSLTPNGWTDLGQQARVGYWPRKLSGVSQAAMQALLEGIQWQQRDLVIFGRTVAQPRLIAYMADPDTPPYTYSGLTLQPTPWTEVVLQVKAAIEQLQPGTKYNSCLLNLYRDGTHHVSWHSDNEKLYGNNPTITSVSFGAPRDFILRHNIDRTRKISTTLSAGDVLIMAGSTQQHWQHSLPKRKGVMQPRINLTFRTIVDSSCWGGFMQVHQLRHADALYAASAAGQTAAPAVVVMVDLSGAAIHYRD